MKRVVPVGLLLVAVVAVALGFSDRGEPATAQQDLSIPVMAISESFVPSDGAVGDQCTIPDESSPAWRTPRQIVVTGPDGVALAHEDLTGEIRLNADDEPQCSVALDISVPERDIYTVYLGEQRIRAYGPNDFPIPEEDAVIFFD